MTLHLEPKDILRTLYATTLTPYVERAFAELRPGVQFHYGHHIRAICNALERVERGETTRLMILMPPRHLKSHCVSVAFTAWLLGRNPARRNAAASYGADLSERFSRDVRRLLQASWHRAVFPDLQLDKRKASAQELLTTRNGGRFATSVGGPFTGSGCDILIVDDPMKAEDARSAAKREEAWDWYRSQHELVFVAFRLGESPTNNVQLGKNGRNRSNVWSYAGATGGAKDPEDDFGVHPTVKPIRMVMDALLDVTAHGELVLDPFLGSGTTLLAAERTQRRCVGVEIEPGYVDLAVRRWQAMTGRQAVHAETGATFDKLAASCGSGNRASSGSGLNHTCDKEKSDV